MLKLVLNTHGHLDHTCGNGLVKEKYHVPILIHEEDAYMLGKPETAESLGFQSFSPKADALLHDGNSVKFGKCTLKVVHTPGHSRGSITLTGEKEAFTGDTLFADSIGRTDFPGSSPADMEKSLKKLRSLRDDFIVYPGHGPMTTMREEKQNNPFLQ